MIPGQESVDKYLSAHYSPGTSALEAYKRELRAQIQALPERVQWSDTPTSALIAEGFNGAVREVLALLDEVRP